MVQKVRGWYLAPPFLELAMERQESGFHAEGQERVCGKEGSPGKGQEGDVALRAPKPPA